MSTHEATAGQSLLARLSTAMVQAQKEHYGRGPTHAKSWFLDDMLLIVLHGGLTTAEQTMKRMDRTDEVRGFRQAYEDAMTGPLTAMVERLTGRRVLTYQSQILFDPDRVVELFVLDSPMEDLRSA